MRTRIALVATTSVAVITVSLLGQAVLVPDAHAADRPSHRTTTHTHRSSDRLTSYVHSGPMAAHPGSLPNLRLADALLAGRPAGTKEVAPVVPPPPPPAPVVTDTVTPYQRAAWERVAMCEEGGNWAADGGRFSGGLGITRANWAAYGGLQYAPEGAEATPDQQIMVAERIQYSPPDQYGCAGW